MPTVFVINGFRFFFYSNENDEPVHVHIEKAEACGKVWLEPHMEPVYFYGFSAREQRQVMQIIEENEQRIKDIWNEHFKQ